MVKESLTPEEKQLLLVSLMGYLPYDVWVADENGKERWIGLNDDELLDLFHYEISGVEPTMKPYLRPMESMTEEEKSWYESLRNALTYQENGEYDLDDFNELNDFLNRKKLDRYGLIEKGLALPAKEGMYQ